MVARIRFWIVRHHGVISRGDPNPHHGLFSYCAQIRPGSALSRLRVAPAQGSALSGHVIHPFGGGECVGEVSPRFWERRGAELLWAGRPSGRHPDLQCGERQRTHKNFEARLYIKRKSVNVS